jgi:predicted DNA binding CopG/RHH family protein
MTKKKPRKVTIPAFKKDQATEAKWWDGRMNVVEGNLTSAIRSRTAKTGGPRRILTDLRPSKNITIRLRLDDLERARALAERKGIGYQTYMKMLLHEALERESQKTRRA